VVTYQIATKLKISYIAGMESPFKYGKIVEGRFFTDREDDTARLVSDFENNINSILISPRRWGKSSLVRKAANKFKRENHEVRVCFIDLFNIRNEGQFYAYFAKQVIKAASGKPEEWLNTAKQFLKKITPSVSFPVEHIGDFELSFKLDEKSEDFEEILNLPEKISEKKKIKILICIDEFQNLSYFDAPLVFQKRLRASWQKHKHAVYCVYGSQSHMMTALFEDKSMPFYKFGDVLYLQKIKMEYLVKFITDSFRNTGKTIEPQTASEIVNNMECHPYYVQQLAHLVWIRTAKKASADILKSALDDMLTQNAPLYMRDVDSFSNTQISFIKALIDGRQSNLYNNNIIREYELGTTGNVSKIIHALTKKDVIQKVNEKYEFIDPAFKLWIKRVYLKSSF